MAEHCTFSKHYKNKINNYRLFSEENKKYMKIWKLKSGEDYEQVTHLYNSSD